MTEFYTPQQVAEMLQISKAGAYNMALEGILPSVRIGRSIRIPKDAFEKFVASGGQAWAGGWRKAEPATPIVRESGRK